MYIFFKGFYIFMKSFNNFTSKKFHYFHIFLNINAVPFYVNQGKINIFIFFLNFLFFSLINLTLVPDLLFNNITYCQDHLQDFNEENIDMSDESDGILSSNSEEGEYENIIGTYLSIVDEILDSNKIPYTAYSGHPLFYFRGSFSSLFQDLNNEEVVIFQIMNEALNNINLNTIINIDRNSILAIDYLEIFERVEQNVNTLIKLKYRAYIALIDNNFSKHQFYHRKLYLPFLNQLFVYKIDQNIPNHISHIISDYLPKNNMFLSYHTQRTSVLHNFFNNYQTMITNNKFLLRNSLEINNNFVIRSVDDIQLIFNTDNNPLVVENNPVNHFDLKLILEQRLNSLGYNPYNTYYMNMSSEELPQELRSKGFEIVTRR